MNPQIQLMLQQAIEAFHGGNFNGADLTLRRVLQVDPKNLPALHVLGLIKASQENFKEAADLLGRAARIHPNDASIQYNLAKALSDCGLDKESIPHHKKAVQLAANNPEAWLNYGKSTSNLGRYADALVCYSKALDLKSDYAEAALNKGATLKELKRYEEAAICADQALLINPNLAEAWSNKAVALKELKRYDEAIAHYDKALSLKPELPEPWSNKGVTLHELKRYDEAITHYDKALSLRADHAESWYNKGVTLHELKRYDEAITHYDKALSLKPDYYEVWFNKGVALRQLMRYDEAITHYDKALSLKPDYYEVWFNKGVALRQLMRYDEAITHYDKALSLKPDYYEVWTDKGVALHELKRYDEAITHYDKALSLKPDYHEVWTDKGAALKELTRTSEAKTCFEKALNIKPDYQKALWEKLFISIPIIQLENENVNQLRDAFVLDVEILNKWFVGKNLNEAYKLVGSTQPFYLAYQECNNKELLYKYGHLCCRLMNEWKKFNELDYRNKKNIGKVRVGIVGEQIRNHSVWNAITKGFVLKLDSSKFEIHIFHLGSLIDEETYLARTRATTFTNNQSTLLGWANAIIDKNIDVLLYPEIGMDALTTQLACLRLAPIQIASWGHPETTGLPSIDYYLSADLFENESSQDAYTEALVKLPNLGCSYSRLQIASVEFDFKNFGISCNEPLLICPGTPYKYTPQNDWIYAELAKRLGECKLIFFKDKNGLSDILEARLMRAFGEVNLRLSDHVFFIPWLESEQFYGLMKCADVFLDTVGFSGFNTAMQAVECALPIVTREGDFMRGRFASGILKRLDLSELIVTTDREYIELTIRLVRDRTYRKQVKEKMIEMRNILYDDVEPIHAFENFLLTKFIDCK